MTSQRDIFIEWLDQMEEKMGWTDYRLSVESGLSSSVFSKARQGLLPKWDALVRIAEALHTSPITAFRKAGLLPPEGGDHATFEDWKHLLDQLPQEDQEEIGEIIEMKFERRKKENALKRLIPKRAK